MRRCCRLFFALSLASLVFSASSPFENAAIVRTVEPAGALVHVTTTYAIKVLDDDAGQYIVTLGENEAAKTSWIEARIKGKSEALPVDPQGVEGGIARYAVSLPPGLSTQSTLDLVFERVLTRATYPWPAQAAQGDEQFMKYEGDLFILSPYHTNTQRTKVRTPVPRIQSYSTPEGVDSFTTDNLVTKSGATVTYGPFSSIPVTADPEFIAKYQRPIAVQYQYEFPVVELNHLERTAEISHWGANLNIENNAVLHNAGPKLKGQFSRLAHQGQMYFGKLANHVLPAVSLSLPAGAQNVYFTDLNGNVSTSRFRPVASVPKGSTVRQSSYLELRPRYPLLGGWNYTHTLGWDQPLEDVAAYDATNGSYIVGIPLLTPIPGAVVNDATLKVILPEGATDVECFPPYTPLSVEHSTHITYLDTIGRPAITLKYKDLTDQHTDMIYVRYSVPVSSHLLKPKTVGTAFLLLFAVVFVARRMEFSIGKR